MHATLQLIFLISRLIICKNKKITFINCLQIGNQSIDYNKGIIL